MFVFVPVTMMYGAVQLAAWNEYSYFPSETEKLPWRVMAVHVVSFDALWLPVIWLGFRLLERHPYGAVWYEYPRRLRRGVGRWREYVVLAFSVVVLVPSSAACGLYTIGRVYLTVKAFIGLRAMAADAYDTPQWSKLIPHP